MRRFQSSFTCTDDRRLRRRDGRKLEKTTVPGVYRRHAENCRRPRVCGCPYVVVWKVGGKQHKQMFAKMEEAREHKRKIGGPGTASRQPLSKETVAGYYEGWIDGYRGRTTRGVQDSTTRAYRISFEHHILPLPIARTKLRDLTPRGVRKWFEELERRNASPATIKRARIALRVMLACALEDDEIRSNSAADARYIPTEAARAKHAKPAPRRLTATDLVAILQAMPVEWRAFFFTLAQTGVRIGELLGLTWENVHLGDDPHIKVVEQVYRGQRKKLKTDASRGRCRCRRSSRHGWRSCAPRTSPPARRYSRRMRPRADLRQRLQPRVAPGADRRGDRGADGHGDGAQARKNTRSRLDTQRSPFTRSATPAGPCCTG